MPENWDALHLGGTDHTNLKSKPFNRYLNKCQFTTGAFAILFNETCYDILIEKLKEEKKLVDIYYAEMMNKLNWFRTKEKLVYHHAGFSEINGKFVDHKHLR